MIQRIQRALPARAVLVALAAVLALALSSALPAPALAALTSVFTATAAASYSHPATGAIEDSGGSSSAVLGQSMVEGVTGDQALVEVDAAGVTWVTVRFGLMSEISDVAFSYDADGTGSSYVDAPATLMQQDAAADTGDYRFAVAGVDSVIRCSLYVAPMGRSVVFFISLSDPVAGNAAGFVESVAAGEEIADPAEDASASVAADAADQEQVAAAVEEGSSAVEGVHEFDAEGNEVGAGSDVAGEPSEGVPALAVVAGVAVVVAVAACGVAVYVAWYKPKRAKQDAAAAAAAFAAGAGPSAVEPTGDAAAACAPQPSGQALAPASSSVAGKAPCSGDAPSPSDDAAGR